MNAEQDSSSLPLLLTLAIGVLVVIGCGWFLLDDDLSLALDTSQPSIDGGELLAPVNDDETEFTEPVNVDDQLDGDEPTTVVESVDSEPTELRVDSDLRKARMAAAAEMFAYPEDQSALHYYNAIMSVDRDNAIAKAELETVYAQIGQAASNHMAAEEFNEAYALADLVAQENPGHPLVLRVTQRLDGLTNEIVGQAIQHAQDGNDDDVAIVLAAAEALPGRNPAYFSAVRESIANIQSSRIAGEQSQIEMVRLADLQATTAWVEKVRTAIGDRRLTSPQGNNALDYLAERDSSSEEKQELTDELIGALKSECAAKIESEKFNEAEALLDVTEKIVGDDADVKSLRFNLEDAFARSESERVLAIDDFVRVTTSPAIYPRRAQERGITGWVDVLFTVNTSGETSDIVIRNADPAELFESAAIDAVRKWTFEPRQFRGQTINQRAAAKLVFRFE